MNSTKKRISILLIVAVYALSLVLGLAYILTNKIIEVFAATENPSYLYYYDNLTTTDQNGNETEYALAKEFYRALEKINESGDFKRGNISLDLTNMLTSDQIKAWVESGNLEIPRAFGAARDTFLMDHPELFYIDVYKIMISAGRSNGVYSAYLDSGKEANVYRDSSINSEEKVNTAIVKFNNEIDKIVRDVTAKADADTSGKNRDYVLAVAANEAIASSVEYDFDAYNDYVADKTTAASPMIYSAYGALVNKKAVCAGFAQAYKAVMDRLEIPCVVVSGYSKGQSKNGEDTAAEVSHAWNYVQLQIGSKQETDAQASETKTSWFAFDTTWNSVNKDINKYSALNSYALLQKHTPYGEISTSKYSLKYPALSMLYYDLAANPSEQDYTITENGFTYSNIYDEKEHVVTEVVSYNGMSIKKLVETENNVRVAVRYHIMEDGKLQWTRWVDFMAASDLMNANADNAYEHQEDKTIIHAAGNSNVKFTQFAIVKDLSPDTDMTSLNGEYVLWENYFYGDNLEVEQHAVTVSQLFENRTYGTYTPAPYLHSELCKPYFGSDVSISSSMSEGGDSSMMADKNAILISLVYDEPLHVLDTTKDIGVNVTAQSYNTMDHIGFTPFEDGKTVHLVEDANGVPNTLQFKFKPSLMFEHNREGYSFTFENVGSAKIVDKMTQNGLVRTTSDKAPNYAYYMFSRRYIACPKCFNYDGRLWVDCCAQPTLVDNSDLSAMNFKDSEGNSTFTEEARSQMMLVVNDVREETVNSMLNAISDSKDIKVSQKDIKASQTYDIDLQICGKYATIPDGSYVKIALGFPEGYGPENEGVTFKLFHRKHIKETDTYVIEEVPCVVTKFGIVATVTSFSPYMVAVVPEEKATEKTVFASIDGKGGKLTLADGQIQTVKKGGSYTYTITPDAGYKLYNVTLNGKSLTERVTDGKLTLTYDELTRNNELEIQYISEEASVRYAEKNIVDPVKVIVSADSSTSDVYTFVEGDVFPENSGITFGIVAAIIVVVIAIVATISVIVIKKKESKQDEE